MAWTERYCIPGGAGAHDGTSEANAWSWSEALAGMAAGQRINVKAGTYTQTTVITSAIDGIVSSPIWFRGYESTPGDLDDKTLSELTAGTSMPLIDHTSNYTLMSGDYIHMSHIAFRQSDGIRPALYPRCGRSLWHRCSFEHTNGYWGINRSSGTDYSTFSECTFKTTGSATVIINAEHTTYERCVIEAGTGYCLDLNSASNLVTIVDCVFVNGSRGIHRDSTHPWLNCFGCVFYNQSDYGIYIDSSGAAALSTIVGNVFHSSGTAGIQMHSAGTGCTHIADNLFYNCGANIVNVTEDKYVNAITDSSDPFVDAAGGDYTLQADSGGRGLERKLPDGQLTYRDLGAIQAKLSTGTNIHPVGF